MNFKKSDEIFVPAKLFSYIALIATHHSEKKSRYQKAKKKKNELGMNGIILQE